MIAVAESGSTKTHWVLFNTHVVTEFTTQGLNPQVQNDQQLKSLIEKEIRSKLIVHNPDILYFYGAGCSSEDNCKRLNEIFRFILPDTRIFIYHDLTAAGRALFQKEKGIACILGTGSNSGIYDGKDIRENISALGYILGDEGSGAYMGKIFLRDLIYGLVPHSIAEEFKEKYKLNKQRILNSVYLKPKANVFLASIMEFLVPRKHNNYVHDLIFSAFQDFFQYHILPYSEASSYNLGFIGSVAYYNENILKEVADANSFRISMIENRPIDRLVQYHLQEKGKNHA
jgi:glucosamine kinase